MRHAMILGLFVGTVVSVAATANDDPFDSSGYVESCFVCHAANPTRFADPRFPLLVLVLLLCVWIYEFMFESKARWILELAPVRVGTVICMIFYLVMFSGSGNEAFIYFQF